MQLRNYTDSDFPQLEQLLKTCNIYNQTYDKRDIIKRKIGADPESVILLEENGKIIGCVFIIYDPWSSYIYRLCVIQEHQGKGLAAKLMDEAENRLKERGTNPVTIFIEEDNKDKLNFYLKRGYRDEGKVLM